MSQQLQDVFLDKPNTIQLLQEETPVWTALQDVLTTIYGVSIPNQSDSPSVTAYEPKVIDGDTIEVKISSKDIAAHQLNLNDLRNGQAYQTVKVRYLLIDTPESQHPSKPVQPFAKEAAARNQQLLQRASITLRFDVGERVDAYNRVLAYVYTGDILIQEVLIREGYGRVAYVYEPNTRELDRLLAAEKEAKAEKLRIWSISNYVHTSGFY